MYRCSSGDILYFNVFVTAALAQYGTVSTPYIGRAQESPDESGLYIM